MDVLWWGIRHRLFETRDGPSSELECEREQRPLQCGVEQKATRVVVDLEIAIGAHDGISFAEVAPHVPNELICPRRTAFTDVAVSRGPPHVRQRAFGADGDDPVDPTA